MQNDLTIRDARSEDLPSLEPILQAWIRDSETKAPLPSEIQGIMDADNLDANRRVATGGKLVWRWRGYFRKHSEPTGPRGSPAGWVDHPGQERFGLVVCREK